MSDKQEQKNIIIDAERLQEYLEMACLFSDKYFKIFLQNQTYKPAQFILRTILKNPFLVVQNITVQKVISNIGGREVQLDFYCEQIEEDGKIIKRINVEIQRQSGGAIPKRARFHSSSLDSASLKENDPFKALTENYVIFFAEKDIFKQKQALYNIQRYIEFTDEKGNIRHLKPFNDGSHIIYINGKYKDTTNDLGKIIHDFHCVKTDEMLCEELRKPAEYFKNKKKGENEMYKDIDIFDLLTDESKEKIMKELKEAKAEAKKDGRAEGLVEGRAEGEKLGIAKGEKLGIEKGEKLGIAKSLLNSIKSLMETMNVTAEKAMKALKIPQEEHEFYLAQLQSNTP